MIRRALPCWAVAALILMTAACAVDQSERRSKEDTIRLAEAFILDGKARSALGELLEVEKKYPKDAQIQFLLGLAFEGLKRIDLASRHYEAALKIKPNFSQARNNLAVVLMKEEKYAEAIDHLKRIEEDLLYPTPQYAAANLAWAYYRSGQLAMAEKYYRLALDHYERGFAKDSTYIRVLVNLGRTLLDLERPAEAVEYLKTAAGFVSDLPEIHYELGRAYAALGDQANARHAFGKVEKLAPKSELARRAQAAAKRL